MLPTPTVSGLDYDQVYEPAEDSFLLLDCFEAEKPWINSRFSKPVLVAEIGTGLGIVSTFVAKHIIHGVHVATDVNPASCTGAKKTFALNSADVDVFHMDLVGGIRHHQIEILVFNPPYVPAENVPQLPETEDDPTWLDLALMGGADGMETTWKVLDTLDDTLSEDGVAYVLFCARNNPLKVMETLQGRGWDVEEVIKRKAGWEVLSILRIARKK